MKTYDYINRVVITLPLTVYEGTWTTLSPLVAMHHHDLACAYKQSFTGEFRQHDGVMTVMMLLPMQGFA